MAPMPSAPTYSGLAKFFHWITVLIVFPMFFVGMAMADRARANLFDATTNQMYSMHKLMGFILLWLIVARSVYKLKQGSPPPVPTLTVLERMASAATHHMLYVLLLVVPILGWAGVSAFPALRIFDAFSLPAILPANEALAKTILQWHGWIARLLMLVILAHIGAALMHGVLKRDGVMNRMIGWWPLRK
ncbi:MAG: cytochrome b [Beijerinckiaceae bacterium]